MERSSSGKSRKSDRDPSPQWKSRDVLDGSLHFHPGSKTPLDTKWKSPQSHHLRIKKTDATTNGACLILTEAYALGIPVIVNRLDVLLLFQILWELLRGDIVLPDSDILRQQQERRASCTQTKGCFVSLKAGMFKKLSRYWTHYRYFPFEQGGEEEGEGGATFQGIWPSQLASLGVKIQKCEHQFFVFKLIYVFVYLLVPNGSLDKTTTKNAHFYHKFFPHPLIRM